MSILTQEQIQRAAKCLLRWRILVCGNASRPMPINEELIKTICDDVSMSVSPEQIRIEIDYLEKRELVKVRRGQLRADAWAVELTRMGVDVVEYTVACDAGIARPDR